MTKPSTIRSACASVLGAATIFAIACSGSEQRQPDSAGAPPATPPAIAPQPGALAKPIDQLTGDELYAFTHGLRFTGGQERQRRCRGDASCRGPNPQRTTRVRVDAVDLQDSLTGAALPPNGVVAIRALNRGQLADTMYGMRPGQQFEYYLIVLPAAQGANANWRLEELTTTQGARSHRSIASGRFTHCNHPFVRGARADFKRCTEATPVRPAAFGAFLQSDGEPPFWMGCAFGCCTADPPDGRT